jgi:ankyrin repeat protein
MKDLKNLLGKLPDTLEASYDTIYHQMMRGKESGRIAGNAIRWLLCSKRQLQSSELIAAAVLTNRDETDTTDEDPEEYEEDDILQFCSNLVVLDQSLGVFRLAHLSVREYFEKKEGYEQWSIQNMAFGTCLDILASKSTSDSALLAGFGSYAIFFWPFHCSDFGPKGPAGAHRDNLLELLLRGCVGSQFFESFEKWASGVRNLLLAQDDYYSKQLQKEGSRKLLASTIGPYHPVFLASTFGFIWILEVLFEDAGFDPGLKNEQEDSGISLGATFGHLSVVEAFLDRGIDVDFKGESLRTPLNRAVVYKHTELAKFLIAKGADVTFRAASTPGVKAYSPLHEAAWVGHCQIIPLLLKKGADVNALSRDASTPLMLAAHNAFIDVVKILLQGGADTTLRDKYGRTAIQLGLFDYSGFIPLRNGRYNSSLTLRTDRVELMKFLLDEGFDVNIVEDGNNTFDCALKQGLRHTLEVLVKKEAQPHLRVWSTESPEVTRWKDESWFPQLLEIISKHNFSVSTFLNSGIPFTVRASREQHIEVIEDTPQVPYVSLQVPDDTILATKVTFKTDSHDQGMLSYFLLS